VRKPGRRSPRPVQVASSRMQQRGQYLVCLQHIRTRIGAAAFTKYAVFVREQDRPQVQEDEVLVRDVVGALCFHYSDRDNLLLHEQGKGVGLGPKPRPLARVVGVVPADELCGVAAAKLMHAQLELGLYGEGAGVVGLEGEEEFARLCLVPLVPQIVPVLELPLRRLFLTPPEGLLAFTYAPPPKRTVLRGFLPTHIERLTAADRAYLNERTSLGFPEM
jgi:16S rRNA processing protein RimM